MMEWMYVAEVIILVMDLNIIFIKWNYYRRWNDNNSLLM